MSMKPQGQWSTLVLVSLAIVFIKSTLFGHCETSQVLSSLKRTLTVCAKLADMYAGIHIWAIVVVSYCREGYHWDWCTGLVREAYHDICCHKMVPCKIILSKTLFWVCCEQVHASKAAWCYFFHGFDTYIQNCRGTQVVDGSLLIIKRTHVSAHCQRSPVNEFLFATFHGMVHTCPHLIV